MLGKLLDADRLHNPRFFIDLTHAALALDFRRWASPVAAVVQFQIAVVTRLGGDGSGGGGVVVVVPLRHRLVDPSHRNQAGEAVSGAASARSVAAAPAGARKGEFRGDLGGKVSEEVGHCQQRAAGNAGGDFGNTEWGAENHVRIRLL